MNTLPSPIATPRLLNPQHTVVIVFTGMCEW